MRILIPRWLMIVKIKFWTVTVSYLQQIHVNNCDLSFSFLLVRLK